jgi:hypothetical protein
MAGAERMRPFLFAPAVFGGVKQGLLWDKFKTTLAAGFVDGTYAEPGHGLRVVDQDIEDVIKTLTGRLRGLSQPTTPVWGESRIYWTDDAGSGFARIPGRTLVALILPEDRAADLAFGWDTATNTDDPRTVGHGLLLGESNAFQVITPGLKIAVDYGPRAMQYLVGVTLNDEGALYWISTFAADSGHYIMSPMGIPAYPTARILWIDPVTATTPLYPYVSGYDSLSYPNGHSIENVRIVDVASWAVADSYRTFIDRFTRANSANNPGAGWTVGKGTWGISGNKLYCSALSPGIWPSVAYNAGLADGIFEWDVTMPGDAIGYWLCVLRWNSDGNFVAVDNNGVNNALRLAVFEGNAWKHTIDSTGAGINWQLGLTYHITCIAKGNSYQVFVDGVPKLGIGWAAIDAGNHFLTDTYIGASCWDIDYRWDNISATPLTITLPTAIQSSGKTPAIWTPGATLANDTFTDADTTRLNVHAAESGGAWTETLGDWTVVTNRATCSVPAVGKNYVTQNIGVANVECSVDIIMPAAFATIDLEIKI